jgi:glucosamine 6-phosphate synthetase-like amidotransferase/phosphosugar isomerase protein
MKKKSLNLKEAISRVIETKLLGTWKMAVMEVDNPDKIYFVKNSGTMILGVSEGRDQALITTDSSLF